MAEQIISVYHGHITVKYTKPRTQCLVLVPHGLMG